MIRVIVESPYVGDKVENVAYLRACLRDCLLRGEAPFASHAIYTQPGVLNDDSPEQRTFGINAGFEWRCACAKTVVYTDLGISSGMKLGIIDAAKHGHEIEFRSLPTWDAITAKAWP